MPHSQMVRSIDQPLRVVPIAFFLACFGSGTVSASGGFGTTIDNACLAYDGSQPYRDQGCRLCHASGSPSNSDIPATELNWWNTGQYTNFCTGGTGANSAPNGIITSPTANQQIAVGATVTFRGSGSDPDGDPLSYSWNFGLSTASGPGPHVVSYPRAGRYTASLTVSDGTVADPTPATRIITVQAPCNGTDADGDGYFVGDPNCGPLDCDDGNPAVNPGANDICGDGIDNNCDGYDASCAVSCTDADGDGYSPEGGVCGPEDCEDGNPAVNPGATEICNDRIDNDCDWELDGSDRECSGEDCLAQNPGVSDPALLVSTDPSRSPAEPLDGLKVSGEIYVFLPDAPGIGAVHYSLDDRHYRDLDQPPWDLVGGSSQFATPLDTRFLTNGWHAIRAEIELGRQTTDDDGDHEDGDDDDRDRSLSSDRDDDDDDDGTGSKTLSSVASFLVHNIATNQAPTCVIDAPPRDMTVAAGASVYFAGTGMDPDGHLPLSYAWDFGGAAPVSYAEDPGILTFNRAGSYLISFVAADSTGLSCHEPATRRVTVVIDDDDDGDDDGDGDGDDDDDDGDDGEDSDDD